MYQRTSQQTRTHLILLRKQGKSIPEISRETNIPRTTVLRHVKNVQIPPALLTLLKEKQGGSKNRALALRLNTMARVEEILGTLSHRDYLFLLIGLYWGEGTKKDFCIINSDPFLIQTFLYCLRTLDVPINRVSISLRTHADIHIEKAKTFWAEKTGINKKLITQVEIIYGKKKGKLAYGMCRVRVRSGIRDRLAIQSAISIIGKECSKRIVFRG